MAHIDDHGYAVFDDNQRGINASSGHTSSNEPRPTKRIIVIAITAIALIGIILSLANASTSMEQPHTKLPVMQVPETKSPDVQLSTASLVVPTPPETTRPYSDTQELPHDKKISSIKSWYNAFTDYMDDCRQSVIREGWTAYWFEGDVVAVNFRSAVGPDGSYSESWYYHDGELYFIYLRGENGYNRVLRLYFWNGKLIRWIEEDGEVHDTENGFYAQEYEHGMEHYREARSAG